MGMIATYQAVSDMELEQGFDLDDVESLQEKEDAEICDIDKMWDALHFLLTGKSASDVKVKMPDRGSGCRAVSCLEDAEILLNTQRQGKRIAEALQTIDFEGYIEQFNMNKFAENEIYLTFGNMRGSR